MSAHSAYTYVAQPRSSIAQAWCHVCVLMVVFMLTGCGAVANEATIQPTATISPLFQEPPTGEPGPVGAKTTPTASTVRVPTATPRPTPVPLEERYRVVPIFEDALAKGWSLDASGNVRLDLKEATVVYTGTRSLAMYPKGGTGKLQFSIPKSTTVSYDRADVRGVSFWLNGGSSFIDPDQVTVTIIGSNKQPYFVEGDTSVTPVAEVSEAFPLFSETQLYFLGIDKSIAPGTWAKVVLWLDEREFDPNYKYVTALAIKNQDREEPLYVDDVHLLVTK